MVDPLNTKPPAHDPKLVAALLSLRKKLEAMPEPLRGPFLVQGLAPYLAAPALPAVDGGEIVAWLDPVPMGNGYTVAITEKPINNDGWAPLVRQSSLLAAESLIFSQKGEIERLTADRDGALRATQALDAVIDRCRLDAADAASRVLSLEEENARLREALKPFAEYLDGMPFDLDNNGKPQPDDTGPGWTYLTAGDFRHARSALQEKQNG